MTGFRSITALLTGALASGWAAEPVARPQVFDIPADTIENIAPTVLEEFTIETTGRKDLISRKGSALRLNSSLISEMPSTLGGGDMLSAIRAAAPVSTASDLTASFSVRGLPTGSNLYTSNGVRIGNPLHLLGLYSTYVPGLYGSYILDSFPSVCLPYNTSATMLEATTETDPDTICGGSVSVGVIESHADINLPLSRKHPTSVRIAARHSYLDKVFPGLLKAGSSTLGYSFTDGGAAVSSRISAEDLLTFSFTGSHDLLSMRNEKEGTKEGKAGWSNIAGGASLTHGVFYGGLGFTYFSNVFEIEEGLQNIKLPSSLTELTAYGTLSLDKGWLVHLDGHMRMASGQRNEALTIHTEEKIPGRSTAWELNAAAEWSKGIGENARVNIGLRLSGYLCGSGERSYTDMAPQPRAGFEIRMPGEIGISARYARLVRFDILLEESSTGMPVNFFLNCDREVRREDNHSFQLSMEGLIPSVGVDWEVAGYWIRMLNAAEYGGGLLNFITPGYSPLADLHYGNGHSAGFTATLTRQWSNLRGRIRYAFGKSRVRIPHFSSEYFPASADRTHDLSAGLTWQFFKHFTLSGNFTYATGTPYTKAKYGYIIGENLICEYYPRNSSRLPPYRRLDLSLTYRLKGRRFNQEFNISVNNALASRNVIFISNSYSLTDGIKVKESVMKSVIPSVTYTLRY